MELRHLRYFAAVAETGNLTRAAQKLFIAQPPLSLQVRQLEDELGVALFSRHPKGMRLTPAGERLLPEAHRMLQRAGELAALAQGAEPMGAATLRLGFVPSASSTVIPDLVRGLRRTHPALTVELREMISDEQAEALVAGQIDAGIARSSRPGHARVMVASSVADPFCLAVPHAEALPRSRGKAPRKSAGEGRVALETYAGQAFVAFTRHRGPAYFDQSIHLCRQAGFSPRIRYEASTLHGVLDLVGAGLGVALVPSSSALLGPKGVALKRLRRSGTEGEVLSLLRRKGDTQALMRELEAEVAAVFDRVAKRLAAALPT